VVPFYKYTGIALRRHQYAFCHMILGHSVCKSSVVTSQRKASSLETTNAACSLCLLLEICRKHKKTVWPKYAVSYVPADRTCSYDWTLFGAIYGNGHDGS
jgi:hypothetical protein